MDGSQIIDNLHSLWFFSNVFSSSTIKQQMGLVTPEMSYQEEAAAEPMDQAEENHEFAGAENLVKRCSKCGEFAAEIKSLKVVLKQVGQTVEELANQTEEKKKKKCSDNSSRRRSKRSLLNERRRIFGELDLGFYGQMQSHESPWLLDEKTPFEHGKLGNQQHHVYMNMKMPPLNDNMAMKQHLKSWAYAVACTVR